jgi:hypothetical protein
MHCHALPCTAAGLCSERFKGANAAHDTGASSKASAGGFEGIYANLSLSSLMAAVEDASKQRRANTKKK